MYNNNVYVLLQYGRTAFAAYCEFKLQINQPVLTSSYLANIKVQKYGQISCAYNS